MKINKIVFEKDGTTTVYFNGVSAPDLLLRSTIKAIHKEARTMLKYRTRLDERCPK